MAEFETTESGAIILVGIEPADEGDRVDRAEEPTRRIVLHSYPAGWHASRAAHPSQRLSRN